LYIQFLILLYNIINENKTIGDNLYITSKDILWI